MNSTTAAKVIEWLRDMFSTHGFHGEIVTDNGPAFTSREFEEFLVQNGIRYTLSPPYHPSNNGQAERYVQTVKNALKKQFWEAGPVTEDTRVLANFLLIYRVTPHAVTGHTPAELLCRRQLHTRWDLLKPDVRKRVEIHQEKQKEDHEYCPIQIREFRKREHFRVKNSVNNKKVRYVPGIIRNHKCYIVVVGDRHQLVHADHLQKVEEQTSSHMVAVPDLTCELETGERLEVQVLPLIENNTVGSAEGKEAVQVDQPPDKTVSEGRPSVVGPEKVLEKVIPEKRCPVCKRQMPERLKDFVTM